MKCEGLDHLSECERISFGEWARKWCEEHGEDDPGLPDDIYFWRCHPHCPRLAASLAQAQEFSVGGPLPPP